MHALVPMFVPKLPRYSRHDNPTCAECNKKLCEYDVVYGCQSHCSHYVCTECVGDTEQPFLCTLTSDVIVRNGERLDCDIKYVLTRGTIVFVKSTSKCLREYVDNSDSRYYRPGYGYRSYGYHSDRGYNRYRPSYVQRAKIKFCHFKSSYGWCSIDSKHGRPLLKPHPNQEAALRIFKSQNFETPLYSSPEIQEKVQKAKRGPKQPNLDPKPMPDPKLYSDSVLTHAVDVHPSFAEDFERPNKRFASRWSNKSKRGVTQSKGITPSGEKAFARKPIQALKRKRTLSTKRQRLHKLEEHFQY